MRVWYCELPVPTFWPFGSHKITCITRRVVERHLWAPCIAFYVSLPLSLFHSHSFFIHLFFCCNSFAAVGFYYILLAMSLLGLIVVHAKCCEWGPAKVLRALFLSLSFSFSVLRSLSPSLCLALSFYNDSTRNVVALLEKRTKVSSLCTLTASKTFRQGRSNGWGGPCATFLGALSKLPCF